MSLFHHIPPILQKTFQRCPKDIMKASEYPVTGHLSFSTYPSSPSKASSVEKLFETLRLPRRKMSGWYCVFFWVTDLYQQFLRFCHQADLAVYPTSHKWISPTYPTYKQGYNLATKWGEPPSILTYLNLCLGRTGICLECIFLATIIWPELKFSEHFSQLTWRCFNVVLVLLVDL